VPYFTRQVGPNRSPIVTAQIGVSHARRAALLLAKLAVPDVVTIQGLIDTGASGTCVDPSVLSQLALSPTGSTLVHTPSTGSNPAPTDTYDISLTIYATQTLPPLVRHTVPVMKSELLQHQGIHALIGRDILSTCLFVYDGATGLFSLAY
jgi:hypothetical protein